MSILIGNLLIAIGTVLHLVMQLFQFLFIARAILSWVSPDPYNQLVQFINGATEPILHRVRQYVPPLGMFDMSIMVALFGIYFLDIFLVQTILDIGNQLRLGVVA